MSKIKSEINNFLRRNNLYETLHIEIIINNQGSCTGVETAGGGDENITININSEYVSCFRTDGDMIMPAKKYGNTVGNESDAIQWILGLWLFNDKGMTIQN